MHHLIFLPDTAKAEAAAGRLSPPTLRTCRQTAGPRLHLNGAEIADLVLEAGGLLGPCPCLHTLDGDLCLLSLSSRVLPGEGGTESGSLSWASRGHRLCGQDCGAILPGHFSPTPMPIRPAPTSWPGSSTRWSWRISAIRRSVLAIKRERRAAVHSSMWAFSRRKESTIAPPARAATGSTLAAQKDELMGRCPECRGQIKLGRGGPGESSGRL